MPTGRLTLDEVSERLDAAYRARTVGTPRIHAPAIGLMGGVSVRSRRGRRTLPEARQDDLVTRREEE